MRKIEILISDFDVERLDQLSVFYDTTRSQVIKNLILNEHDKKVLFPRVRKENDENKAYDNYINRGSK